MNIGPPTNIFSVVVLGPDKISFTIHISKDGVFWPKIGLSLICLIDQWNHHYHLIQILWAWDYTIKIIADIIKLIQLSVVCYFVCCFQCWMVGLSQVSPMVVFVVTNNNYPHIRFLCVCIYYNMYVVLLFLVYIL